MQTLALIWGILALIGMFIGFFPCIGWWNWLNIPFAAVGLILSIVALAGGQPGQKSGAIAGVVCCAVACVFGLIRLILGGGVF